MRKQRTHAPDPLPVGGTTSILGGLGMSFGSALITVFLLVVNGSFALVLLAPLADPGDEWFRKKGLLQFLLFTLPLLMTVLQWMVWDWLRGLASREKVDP